MSIGVQIRPRIGVQFDPFERRGLRVALASSELGGVVPGSVLLSPLQAGIDGRVGHSSSVTLHGFPSIGTACIFSANGQSNETGLAMGVISTNTRIAYDLADVVFASLRLAEAICITSTRSTTKLALSNNRSASS
jgi:hypothetical protein